MNRSPRRWISLVCAALALAIASAGCAQLPIGRAPRERPYAWVGVVSYGQGAVEKDVLEIPLGFSSGEWAANPRQTVLKVNARLEPNNTIVFTVVTGSLPQEEENPRTSGSIYLLGAPAGEYELVYLDPDGARHPVGKVRVLPPLQP